MATHLYLRDWERGGGLIDLEKIKLWGIWKRIDCTKNLKNGSHEKGSGNSMHETDVEMFRFVICGLVKYLDKLCSVWLRVCGCRKRHITGHNTLATEMTDTAVLVKSRRRKPRGRRLSSKQRICILEPILEEPEDVEELLNVYIDMDSNEEE